MFNVWDKSTTITQLVSTNFALVEKNAKYSVVRIKKILTLYRPHAGSGVKATGEAIRKEFFYMIDVWTTMVSGQIVLGHICTL